MQPQDNSLPPTPNQNPQQTPLPPPPQPFQQNQVPPTPSVASAPTGLPVQQAPIPQANNPTPKKSNTKLIIGIIVAVVALPIIGILILIVFIAISNLQISKTSDNFMSAMTQGNVADALKYTDGSNETKQFLEGMVPGVKATKFINKQSTTKNNVHYFLYDLDGAINNTARTEVKKDSGKWQVTGFYSGNNLALVGTETKQVTNNPTPSVSLTDSNLCLVQSDFDNWYKNLYNGKTATESNFHYEDPNRPFSSNVHFPADSLDYSADLTGAVENFINLTKDPSIKGKMYAIHLYGGVGTSQADKDFANKRAEVIKADLIKGGVPADKIIIDPPHSATDYESNPNEVSKGMTRVVVLKFVSTCNNPSSSTSNGR